MSNPENAWREAPPGTVIVKSGRVRKGDWFYIEEIGAWGPVPESGWGEPILNSLVARGEIAWEMMNIKLLP